MTLTAALGLLQGGNIEAAERLCARLLKRHPGDAQTLHLMGLIVLHGGRPADAYAMLKKAAKRQSDNPDCHYNLAECRRALGKPEPAVESYKRALSLRPGDGRAHAGIGEARLDQGRPAEAEKSFLAAVASPPGPAAAWNGLGRAQRQQGRLEDAVESWRRALALDDGLAVVHNNLGLALNGLGRFDEAVAALVRAFALEPENPDLRFNFAACLKNRSVETTTPGLVRWIEACFGGPGIDSQSLLPAVFAILLERDGVAAALCQGGGDFIFPESLVDDSLFLRLLETTFIAKPEWERLLTRLRATLMAGRRGAPPEMLFAMARQCFNNEFVFALGDGELAAALALGEELESGLAAKPPRPSPALERDLARYAMYRPLHGLAGAGRLLDAPDEDWSAGFLPLLEQLLKAPLEEAEIRAAMPSIGGGGDAVSAAVKAMYEENPYPRWITTADRRPQSVDSVLRGLFPHFRTPNSLFGALDVLAAGCGTGRQAINLATRFADSRVLAVDLSFASLGYAKRMAGRLDVGNIDFRQGDILGLAELDQRFHIIECTGVLNALDDPMAGWRVLNGLLRKGGLMKIGLYSETARRHVIAAQGFVIEQGYPSTPEGIRQCRRDIAALAPGRSEREVLSYRDFYSISSCRDLMFHVRELCFTLPRIDAMLRELGLRFIGFELSQLELLAAYRAAYPDDPEMTDLGHWHGFEQDNPDLFMAMYQFWCQKT